MFGGLLSVLWRWQPNEICFTYHPSSRKLKKSELNVLNDSSLNGIFFDGIMTYPKKYIGLKDLEWMTVLALSSSFFIAVHSFTYFFQIWWFSNQDDMETIDSNELRDSRLEKSKHSRKENMRFWYKFPTFLRLKQNDSWDWERFVGLRTVFGIQTVH